MELYNYSEKNLTTELILESDGNKIELRGKTFTNVIMNYTAKIFIFGGRILESDFMTKKLLKWAMVSSEKKEHLMNMTIRIVRSDYVVREIKLNNVYVISHDENYSTKTYSIAIGQHNAQTNSNYKLIPINTSYGRVYTLLQPKDDFTEKLVLGLNSLGSGAVIKSGSDGIKYLKKFGLAGLKTGSNFAKGMARFNLHYLAAHGTNLVISTGSDLYFKSIGFDEAVGEVNPLRDIYENVSVGAVKGANVIFGLDFSEEKARQRGRKAFYFIDLTGAVVGLGQTVKGAVSSFKRFKNFKGITYKLKSPLNSVKVEMGVKAYKANYIILSGGAVARDVNPIIGDGKEILSGY